MAKTISVKPDGQLETTAVGQSKVTPAKTKSRTRKTLGWIVKKSLSTVFWTFLRSGSGVVVVGAVVAWIGAVNLSSSTQGLMVRLTTFLSNNTSPAAYLAGIIVAVGLSYRYPRTIMFLASLVLATFYLTPLYATTAILESYKLGITLSSIGFFLLAAIFLGLKRRFRHGIKMPPAI